MLEDHVRSFLKAMTWRCVASMDTFVISFLITGKLAFGLGIAGAEVFTKVTIYYLHERAWSYLPSTTMRRLEMHIKKIYTPQLFLEDVRRWYIAHNAKLSSAERLAILSVPIEYKPISQDARYDMGRATEMMLHSAHKHEYSLGVTNHHSQGMHPSIQIFGCDHERNQVHMAFSLIHELAHVITLREEKGGSHDEAWAASARRLGICEIAYAGDTKTTNLKPPEDRWRWLDKGLCHYVKSFPSVDWGSLDIEALALVNETLAMVNEYPEILKEGDTGE